MILTLTPNPTIDRVIFVRNFQLGVTVRAEREVVTPSGKGVDASLVIHDLGGDTVALGLNAGLTGRLHENMLEKWGVRHDFVAAVGETRTAVVLVDLAAGRQSTISTSTLSATEDHLTQLLVSVERYADQAWGLICAGSLPPGLPTDSYAHLLRRARDLGLVSLLDTSGEALRHGIEGQPHILKVNRNELVYLAAGQPSATDGAACTVSGPEPERALLGLAQEMATHLGEWASDALIVTLGGQGALAVTREGCYHARPPEVPIANTAGAGDAFNGNLMLALSRGAAWPTALVAGTAAAVSVVMNEGTAVCKQEQVKEVLPQVCVRQLAI